MRGLVLAVLTLTLVLGAAGPAPARVVATSAGGFAAGPALTADGRLVLGERGLGGIRAFALDPTGVRAPQTLDTFKETASRETFTALNLTGTGGVVGAQVDVMQPASAHDGGDPTVAASRGLTLAPSVALGSCPLGSGTYGHGMEVAGGTGFVATIGEDCGPVGHAIGLHRAGGTRALATDPGVQTSLLRAAGDQVAWAEARSRGGYWVVLARASTGAVALRIPVAGFGVEDLALGSDGTIAWIAQSALRGCTHTVYLASLAEPTPRALTGPATPCPFGAGRSSGHSAMAIAGGRVVYPAVPSFAVTDGQGGAHLVSEVPAAAAGPGPVAFDGRTLYGVRTECDAERLLGVDVDAAGPPPSASLQFGAPLGCPVARSGSTRARMSPTRRVIVRVSCPAGCRGTLRLTQEHRRDERPAGQTEIAGRGTLTVRVPLARYAAGLAGCTGGLRLRTYLDQTVYPSAQRTFRSIQWLGLVRVSGAGRCRHLAAPPFRFPLRYR